MFIQESFLEKRKGIKKGRALVLKREWKKEKDKKDRELWLLREGLEKRKDDLERKKRNRKKKKENNK